MLKTSTTLASARSSTSKIRVVRLNVKRPSLGAAFLLLGLGVRPHAPAQSSRGLSPGPKVPHTPSKKAGLYSESILGLHSRKSPERNSLPRRHKRIDPPYRTASRRYGISIHSRIQSSLARLVRRVSRPQNCHSTRENNEEMAASLESEPYRTRQPPLD
jgi:hypothetical protein